MKTLEQLETTDAEAWVRSRFGVLRGHPAWRSLIEAFNAGKEHAQAGIRAEAMEEAAQICDGIERKKWETLRDGGKLEGIGPRDCATAIREMK